MARKRKQSEWNNRIIRTGEKPASDFVLNERNPRIHTEPQEEVMAAILKEVGWVTGVIENKRTGNLIDGHLRVRQALAKDPKELIPFTEVDISEQDELKLLAVFDRIGAMALSDAEKVQDLLNDIEFESEILTQLLEAAEPADIDIDAFFEPLEEAKDERFTLEIVFSDEAEYKTVTEALSKHGKTRREAILNLIRQ